MLLRLRGQAQRTRRRQQDHEQHSNGFHRQLLESEARRVAQAGRNHSRLKLPGNRSDGLVDAAARGSLSVRRLPNARPGQNLFIAQRHQRIHARCAQGRTEGCEQHGG